MFRPCFILFAFIILVACDDANEHPPPDFKPLNTRIEQTVFRSGEEGYHTYRIPALITAPNGDLIAFCEGRKEGRGDSGDIDLLLKRSRDGGKNWDATLLVWGDDTHVWGNPCPVIDRETNTIFLLLTTNLSTDKEKAIINKTAEDTRRVFVMESVDNGHSWTPPKEITNTTKDLDWGWYATGPGVGIQIQAGPHAGRLIIPSDHSYTHAEPDSAESSFEYGSHIIYSDDHGKSWQLGGVVRPKVNECQVFEVADGTGKLILNMRAYFGRNVRAQAESTDGGMSWTNPKDVPGLIEPVCQASILRYRMPGSESPPWVVFSNPASTKRENLMLKFSLDEGTTWPFSQMIYPGKAAYSCLTITADSLIGCLFECGEESPYEEIRFVALEEVGKP